MLLLLESENQSIWLAMMFLSLIFFFADGLFLLAEASMEQARVISAVLDSYCYSSEAKLNDNKTLLYFSKNVGDRDVVRISGALDFSVTQHLGKYLGGSPSPYMSLQ